MAGLTREQRAAKAARTGDEAAAEMPSALVRMVRDPAEWPAPHTADVAPSEVENYAAGGWHVV